jgi:hypothetical protein
MDPNNTTPVPRDDSRMTHTVKTNEDGTTTIALVIVGGIDRSGKMVRRIDSFSINPELSYTQGNWSSLVISLCPITYLVCVLIAK